LADNVITNLRRQTAQILKTQKRVVSGKVINKPSDDPIGMGKVLDYRSSIASIDQYNINIANGKSRIQYTDTILSEVHDLLREAKSIAADANLDNYGAGARRVESIRDQVLSLANSVLNEDYIFSGYATDTEPFAADGTYNGSAGEKTFMVGSNAEVDLEADGSVIFQGAEDIFTVLSDLETALDAADETTTKAQVQLLQNAIDDLTITQADFSAKFQRMEMAQNHWDHLKPEIQNLLSETEDADLAAEIINLQVQQASFEVSLAVSADIIQPTLMQFLN
jgi:flagellar hook-associated protein 3 FlgL